MPPIVAILTSALIFSSSIARAQEGWKVEEQAPRDRKFIVASANGLLAQSNTLRLIFLPGRCESAEVVFTILSDKRISERHRDTDFRTEMAGRPRNVKMRALRPLHGNAAPIIAIFSAGFFEMEDLSTWAARAKGQNRDALSVKLLDGSDYRAKDLFSMTEEHWTFVGYTQAITEAHKRCTAQSKPSMPLKQSKNIGQQFVTPWPPVMAY